VHAADEDILAGGARGKWRAGSATCRLRCRSGIFVRRSRGDSASGLQAEGSVARVRATLQAPAVRCGAWKGEVRRPPSCTGPPRGCEDGARARLGKCYLELRLELQ